METSAKIRNNAKDIFIEAAKQLHLASIGKSNNASMKIMKLLILIIIVL